jgi:acyl-CoA thioester hydrolase
VIEAKLRVIYGDTDQMGVVYYANYFRFFEFARGEFFRAKGASYLDFEKQGYGMPVIEAHANYRAPLRYDDLIIIKAWIEGARRASVTFKYELRRDGSPEVLTEGHTVHACINKEGRPTKMPPELLALLDLSPG